MTVSFAYRFSLAPSLAPFRPEIEHALDFLDRAHGLRCDPTATRVLHYGPEPPPGALAVPAVLFPSGVRVAEDGIHPAREALERLAAGGGTARLFPGTGPAVSDGCLAYDAIGLIALMLTRLEERDSPAADRYGRFPYAASLAARFHAPADPAADVAARDLAMALTGGPAPSATSYEVMLTHDVDRLRGYHRLVAPLRGAAGDVVKRGKPIKAVTTLLQAYGGGDPWRSARHLMARSEAIGLPSRFYFIGPSTQAMDSPYSISMVPLLRRLIAEISARGHVVGFHPGFGTHSDPLLWRSQKEGLERIADAPVMEGRQHVLGYDAATTPDIWAANAMRLDLTLAFPETTDFRAGTCRRFKAYSLVRRAPLPLEQASTTLMDFGLFGGKYRGLTLQQALDEAARTTETCRRYGGTLVLLQHLGRCDAVVDRFFDTLLPRVSNGGRAPLRGVPSRAAVARELPHPLAPTAPSPAFKVGLTESFGWRHRHAGPWRLWLKGNLDGEGDAIGQLSTLPTSASVDAVSRFVSALRGQFALVAEGPDTLLAVVDRLRSIPLVYGWRNDILLLDQVGRRLQEAFGVGLKDIDSDAALSIALSGYTIGDDTLYRAIRQLGPGQLLLARADGRIEHGCYYRFEPYHPVSRPRAELKRSLKEVIRTSLEHLIAIADGRPIAIPLSSGCDSRLIASGLKALGHRNVLTFSYGLPGNHEATASREIAEQLGFSWRFVPFSWQRMRAAYASADYAAYRASADSLTGVHFPQDYLALVTLKRDGYLPSDAVIVNGQSGDFITGNHVPEMLTNPQRDLAPAAREQRVIDALVTKHFKQWETLTTPANRARIRAMLTREIAAIGGMPADPEGDHGVYEWCEFQDRQSKYVVNGQRLYEHLGYAWHLPLWDDAWLEFWAHAPVDAKRKQNLYREVLMEDDFGGVWRTIPINAKTVCPSWIVPVRVGLRSVHGLLGRQRWHAFERRYLQYWMDNLRTYAAQPYLSVAADHRRPISGIAYHIEDYLREKGLAYDGTPL